MFENYINCQNWNWLYRNHHTKLEIDRTIIACQQGKGGQPSYKNLCWKILPTLIPKKVTFIFARLISTNNSSCLSWIATKKFSFPPSQSWLPGDNLGHLELNKSFDLVTFILQIQQISSCSQTISRLKQNINNQKQYCVKTFNKGRAIGKEICSILIYNLGSRPM